MKTFTRNYNGEPIKANEVMVPFEYTELDAKTVTNPECISSITVGKKSFRVIYKAVDQTWEKDARATFNLYQNEELGHYAVPNSISRDATEDKYELELVSATSAEDILRASEIGNEKSSGKYNSTIGFLTNIENRNEKLYTDKTTIDTIGQIEARGEEFSFLNKKIMSSRASTEGGTSIVYKYSDELGAKYLIHEVTDAKGYIIHRDFDAVRISSGQLINKEY